MRRSLFILLIAAIGIVLWYGQWRASMAPHVKRIEATIAHYNERYKTTAYRATFKADAVYASGFPFARRVTVDHPNLAMVWGNETYAVEADYIILAIGDEGQGRYGISLPPTLHALYAEAGKVPESYSVSAAEAPSLWMRVQDVPPQCGDDACRARADAVLQQLGFQPHGAIVLTASLNGKSETIAFPMMALPKPVFMAIPADPSRPVSLFIGMLREALVFKDQ